MNLGKRIMVMGFSGSGKSTLARQLGAFCGLPVVHSDMLFWKPGWVESARDAYVEKMRTAADQPAWVIDGDGKRTRDCTLQRADTVIYIDMNRCTRLYRAIKRRFRYHGRTRPDMTEGCPEKLDWLYIKGVWSDARRSRKSDLAWIAGIRPPEKVYQLKGIRAVKRFLRRLAEEAA